MAGLLKNIQHTWKKCFKKFVQIEVPSNFDLVIEILYLNILNNISKAN